MGNPVHVHTCGGIGRICIERYTLRSGTDYRHLPARLKTFEALKNDNPACLPEPPARGDSASGRQRIGAESARVELMLLPVWQVHHANLPLGHPGNAVR